MGQNTTRARDYDEAIADALLDRLRDGETLKSICRDPVMPTTNTVWLWTQGSLGAPSTWCNVYARARLDQADGFAADIIELADGVDDAAHAAGTAALGALDDDATETEKRRAYFYAKKRSVEGAKLAIDARKWSAARMNPARWGDKVTVALGNEDDKPLRIDFAGLTTEQLEAMAELETKLAANSAESTE